MEMKGEYRIPAEKTLVWAALNDPEVLKECIPGCESLEKTSEYSMAATVRAKVGPVSAKFNGEVHLEDLDPPNSYTIRGEGKGGAAGFARGEARVSLAEDGAETVLSYVVDAKVGGKLAQIGSRLIDATAKKMADDFFGRFRDKVHEANPAEAPGVSADAAAAHSGPGSVSAAVVPPGPPRDPDPEPAPAVVSGPGAPVAAQAAADAVRPDTAHGHGGHDHDSTGHAGHATQAGTVPMWLWIGGVVVVVAVVVSLFTH